MIHTLLNAISRPPVSRSLCRIPRSLVPHTPWVLCVREDGTELAIAPAEACSRSKTARHHTRTPACPGKNYLSVPSHYRLFVVCVASTITVLLLLLLLLLRLRLRLSLSLTPPSMNGTEAHGSFGISQQQCRLRRVQ